MAAVLASAVTALAVVPAVEYSRIRHRCASYHFDSAGYRWRAVQASRVLRAQGLGAALRSTLRRRDALDLGLRLLGAPRSLTHRYGHLVVAVPALWLFLLLLAGFALGRTGSSALALLTCLPILAFPAVYRPEMGIADCVPDAAGAGLLGIALVCWIRSENLIRIPWAAACGLSLGLLAWQRTVMASYAAFVFAPLVVVALVRQLGGRRTAGSGLVAMLVPSGLLAGALWAAQGDELYRYYAVAGYAYTSPTEVARYLYHLCGQFGRPGIALSTVAAVGAGLLWLRGERDRRGALAAAWFVAGLPLAVVLTRGLYHGFLWLWLPALMVLPATLMARGSRRWIAVGLLAVSGIGATAAAHASTARQPIPQVWVDLRPFLDEVIAALPARPLRVQLLVNEWDVLLQNQAFFDAGRRGWERGPALVSQHDSYYRGRFGSLHPRRIAKELIRALEEPEEMWVVAFCDPSSVDEVQTVAVDGPEIARPTLRKLNALVAGRPGWQPWRRLPAHPLGCVVVYRHASP